MRLILQKGKKVILLSSPPESFENETANKTSHKEYLENVIMKIAEEYKMDYISVYKLFYEYWENRGIPISSLLANGLHPDDESHYAELYLIANALGFGAKIPNAT